MTSKELNEVLNKTRRTKDISLSVEQVEELIKDLEILDKYKEIMCEPIQDLMKGLEEKEKQSKILEILKKYLKVKSLELGIEDIVICCENENDFNEIKEWLDNEA